MHGMNLLQGALSTLSSLFKHAKRDDVVEFAPTVLNHISKCELTTSDNTLLRKLNVKLVQVFICFFPVKGGREGGREGVVWEEFMATSKLLA